MCHQVTLQVSEEVIRKATIIAFEKICTIEDVLLDWIEQYYRENFSDEIQKTQPKD
jgi:hypothetical protein